VPDLMDYRTVEGDLRGYDACYFCLGVSSAGMDEAKYSRITLRPHASPPPKCWRD
jgi:hypothetical protein